MPDTPTIDTELGEFAHEDEAEIAEQIRATISATIQNGPRPARRDAHPKAHGCVQAEFHVRSESAA